MSALADVIKAYVELGLGVGIVAAMAIDSARDKTLQVAPSEHLFEANTHPHRGPPRQLSARLRLPLHPVLRARDQGSGDPGSEQRRALIGTTSYPALVRSISTAVKSAYSKRCQ
jgi:hypothetical protein